MKHLRMYARLTAVAYLIFSPLVVLGQLALQSKDSIDSNHAKDSTVDKNVVLETHSEQERLDTIVRAFKHLPEPERQRLGVEIDIPVLEGTEKALQLKRAWLERQQELKIALSSMIKPAEHMGKILKTLNDATVPLGDKVVSFKDLEALLADIDNARDFHTIGGWPTLVKFLSRSNPIDLRMYAAWSIGTAVKNSNSYQDWVLEEVDLSSFSATVTADMTVDAEARSSGLSVTALRSLVDILNEDITDDSETLIKRSLYAISSSARGNVDVQEALLRPERVGEEPLFLKFLYKTAISNSSTSEIRRKVWTFIADMMEERQFVRIEVHDMDYSPEQIAALDALIVLGDSFCSSGWGNAAAFSLQRSLADEHFSLLKELEESIFDTGGHMTEEEVDYVLDPFSISGLEIEDEDSSGAEAAVRPSPVELQSGVQVGETGNEDWATARAAARAESNFITVPLRATISSLLTVLGALQAQCPGTVGPPVSYLIQSLAREVTGLHGSANKEIRRKAMAYLLPDEEAS